MMWQGRRSSHRREQEVVATREMATPIATYLRCATEVRALRRLLRAVQLPGVHYSEDGGVERCAQHRDHRNERPLPDNHGAVEVAIQENLPLSTDHAGFDGVGRRVEGPQRSKAHLTGRFVLPLSQKVCVCMLHLLLWTEAAPLGRLRHECCEPVVPEEGRDGTSLENTDINVVQEILFEVTGHARDVVHVVAPLMFPFLEVQGLQPRNMVPEGTEHRPPALVATKPTFGEFLEACDALSHTVSAVHPASGAQIPLQHVVWTQFLLADSTTAFAALHTRTLLPVSFPVCVSPMLY